MFCILVFSCWGVILDRVVIVLKYSILLRFIWYCILLRRVVCSVYHFVVTTINIDKDLSCSMHTISIVRTASQRLGFIFFKAKTVTANHSKNTQEKPILQHRSHIRNGAAVTRVEILVLFHRRAAWLINIPSSIDSRFWPTGNLLSILLSFLSLM